MPRLVFAPLAELDLDDILAYIARDKPEVAVKWVQTISHALYVANATPVISENAQLEVSTSLP